MRCVLIGNYGVGNVGDEALCEYFLKRYPDIRWTVLSAFPSGKNQVPRFPCGFTSLLQPWWKTIFAVRNADCVVFGGGSLFTDSESVMACVIWWVHTLWIRFLRRPYFLAFQGAGPLRSGLANWLTRSAYEHAAFVSVRDQESLRRLVGWKLKSVPVLSFDPAFALFANFAPSTLPRSEILTIIPRGNSDEGFLVEVSRVLSLKKWFEIRILLMQPDAQECRLGEKIRLMAGEGTRVLHAVTVSQLLECVSASTLVVTQRYHGGMAAFALGKEVIICPQRSGDKLDALKAQITKGAGERERLLGLIRAGSDQLFAAMTLHATSSIDIASKP